MTMFEVDTWVVRRGKRKEQEAIMKEIFEYGKKHPEAADYVESLRFFQQGIGGSPVGKFVLITEFESLTDMDRFYKILDKNEEWLKIKKKWSSVVDPDTMQVALWNDKLRELWVEQ